MGSQNVEGGLGAVINQDKLGITGYMQYTMAFVSGRFQVDLMSDQKWIPQVVLGVPLKWEQFRFEPHVAFEYVKDQSIKPKIGLRLQYVF